MASSFSTLRQRGYGTIYAIKVEGIPYIFTEASPLLVESEAYAAVPSGYSSAPPAFAVVSASTIDQELDRESSIARGKALSIVLAWNTLEAMDILDQLFRRPEFFTTLTADLSATATTVAVVSTADFPATGAFYLGRELIRYAGKTGTTFTGCTRGHLSYKYKFRKDDPGSHGIVTPTPYAWKGRFLTIYEHLLSPEGRMLDSTWTEGTYQRELWKGYLSAPPVPGKLGMMLQAMPLIRLAAQELGCNLQGDTLGLQSRNAQWMDYPVYVAEGASIDFEFWIKDGTTVDLIAPIVETGKVAGDWPALAPGIMPIQEYMRAVAAQLETYLAGYAGVLGVTFSPDNTSIFNPAGVADNFAVFHFQIDELAGGADEYPFAVYIIPSNAVYWLHQWPTSGIPNSIAPGGIGNSYTARALVDVTQSRWLAVKNIEGDSALDFVLEPDGIGILDAGDQAEVIRWSSKTLVDYLGASIAPWTVLYIAERMVGSGFSSVEQLPADLNDDGTLTVITGKIGSLDDVAETILQSSGGGERGAKDTLPLGFGMGVPSEWMDLDATGTSLITSETLPLISEGRGSFADIFAGWYQLSATCLAMRRNSSGVLQFQRASVVPSQVISTDVAGYLGFPLAKSDVVVGGTEVPRLVVAPNRIAIDTTAGPYQSAQFTYNAVGRIQAEGAYSLSLNIPGGRSEILSAAALSIMSRGLGQSIVKFEVAPWVDAQVGDAVSITVAHPLLFGWSRGTRQPPNVPGRVVGWSLNMQTGEQSLTILLDGILAPGFWLCPTTVVTGVAGSVVTVVDGSWFRSGERARFYNRGKESSDSSDLAIDTVSGNDLTLSSSPPAWLTSANATRVTYPAYSSASTDQQNAWMYVEADKFWRV